MAKLRVLLTVVILATSMLAWTLWDRAALQSRSTEQVISAIAANSEQWSSEDLYRKILNRSRTPFVIDPQTSPVTHHNPKRIRVLVLGDSFTNGTGLVDYEARWAAQLERRLEELTAPGAVEVVPLAMGGASTYTHAAWADAVAQKDTDRLKNVAGTPSPLDAPFDAVILGYVENDRAPGWLDAEIPPPLLRLASETGVEIPTRFHVFASDEEYNNVIFETRKDPNGGLFDLAAASIVSSFAPAPVLWVPLSFLDSTRKAALSEQSVFEAAGFRIVQTPTLAALIRAQSPESLMVTGIDAHPGVAVQRAYAADVAPALLRALSQPRIAEAISSALPPTTPLVSFFAPEELKVTSDPTTAQVALEPGAIPPSRCTPVFENFPPSALCRDNRRVFAFEREGASGNEGPLVEAPPQYFPCVALGVSYAAVSFAHRFVPGESLTLESPSRSPAVDVYKVNHDPSGNEVFTRSATLRPGGMVRFQDPASMSALLFVPAGTPQGCDTASVSSEMEPFRISIRVVR